MTLIEKDQVVYVRNRLDESGSALKKYVVVDANKYNFYAIPEDATCEPKRFWQKTLVHETRGGDYARAYRTEEEYWSRMERLRKVNTLHKELRNKVDMMDLEQLEVVIHAFRTEQQHWGRIKVGSKMDEYRQELKNIIFKMSDMMQIEKLEEVKTYINSLK